MSFFVIQCFNEVMQTKNISMLSGLKQMWNCYSLQIQQHRDVLSHQADHVDPVTEDSLGQFIFIIIKHKFEFIQLLFISPSIQLQLFYSYNKQYNIAYHGSRGTILSWSTRFTLKGETEVRTFWRKWNEMKQLRKNENVGIFLTLAPAAPFSPLAPSRPGWPYRETGQNSLGLTHRSVLGWNDWALRVVILLLLFETLTLCPLIPGSPGVPGNPRAPWNTNIKY